MQAKTYTDTAKANLDEAKTMSDPTVLRRAQFVTRLASLSRRLPNAIDLRMRTTPALISSATVSVEMVQRDAATRVGGE